MKTKTRRRHLERMRQYIAVLQPILRLQAWNIQVANEPPDVATHWADCAREMDGWEASIRFADELLCAAPDFQRTTVIHELLHLHTHDWHVACVQAFAGLSSTSQEWARERHDHEHERCIDLLALVLAPLLPLPGE